MLGNSTFFGTKMVQGAMKSIITPWSDWRIKLDKFDIKPKQFLNYIRMEGEFNFFWYKNGTGSHEKHHNPLIINCLSGERGIIPCGRDPMRGVA